MLVWDIHNVPADIHSQFGVFSSGAHVLPSNSSLCAHKLAGWLHNKFLPLRRAGSTLAFDDDKSILAQQFPCPARMLDDAASLDSGSFVFYYSSAPPAELDAVSLDSISITDKSPPTDGDLAEHARQCEAATAKSDGWLREAQLSRLLM
jgi:hypothetical protein